MPKQLGPNLSASALVEGTTSSNGYTQGYPVHSPEQAEASRAVHEQGVYDTLRYYQWRETRGTPLPVVLPDLSDTPTNWIYAMNQIQDIVLQENTTSSATTNASVMGITAEAMDAQMEAELLAAEQVLDIEFSFDLAEPNYLVCLELIRAYPSGQSEIANLLVGMYAEKRISDEPLAYLMHVLKWPEVKLWVERQLASDPAAIATGAGHENIISAYSADWGNRDFYTFGRR